MSAHVLLNSLNELGKKVRCEALPSILSDFPKDFIGFNNTGAWMQDTIYNMTPKSHFSSKFVLKRYDLVNRKRGVLYRRQPITLRRNLHI